jgi:uncharacterized surface anchored protein
MSRLLVRLLLLIGAGVVLVVAGPGVRPSWSEQTRPSPSPSRPYHTKSPSPSPSHSPSKSPSASPSKSPSKSPTASPTATTLPVTGGATGGTLTGLVVAGLGVAGAGGLLYRIGRRRRP